jgi:hypothetical protein
MKRKSEQDEEGEQAVPATAEAEPGAAPSVREPSAAAAVDPVARPPAGQAQDAAAKRLEQEEWLSKQARCRWHPPRVPMA